MIATETDRESLLRRLVSDAEDAAHTMSLLAGFGWDYNGRPVIVARERLIQLLAKYLRGELSTAQLEFWANCVEGRDDLAFEAADQSIIEALIFELANPALTQPLTLERARQLLASLRLT
jgi:hypothetical protein